MTLLARLPAAGSAARRSLRRMQAYSSPSAALLSMVLAEEELLGP
jgi:hypothetical protein